MIREFLVTFRKNIIINGLLAVLAIITLQLLFSLLHFGTAPNLNEHGLEPFIEEHEIFQVILPLTPLLNEHRGNPDLNEEDFLEMLQSFYYDVLLASNTFTSFSHGLGQPVRVSGRELAVEKMDQNAFSLFGEELEVLEGRSFIPDDFENFVGYIPIILGYEFGYYNEIGDRFQGEYHGLEIEFKVIGILAPDQLISSGVVARFLDDVLFLPYISDRDFERLNQEELRFWTAIYMDKMYSLLLVENSPPLIDLAINEIHAGAHIIGFGDYLQLASVELQILETIETRNLVRHQQEIMMALFASIASVLFIIINILGIIKYRMREKAYYTLMLTGYPKWKSLLVSFIEIVIIFSVVFLIAHEYLMFDSGLLLSRHALSPAIRARYPEFGRWWMYRHVWGRNNNMQHMLWYTIGLGLITMIYPIFKLTKLYKRGGDGR